MVYGLKSFIIIFVLLSMFSITQTAAFVGTGQDQVIEQHQAVSIKRQSDNKVIPEEQKLATLHAKLLPDSESLGGGIGGEYGEFGRFFAIDGDRALVGGPFLTGAGAVLVFEFDGQDWVEVDRLETSKDYPTFGIGGQIRLLGDRAVIAGSRDDSFYSGRVSVFEYDGEEWKQTAVLKSTRPWSDDAFSSAIDLSSDRIIVGSLNDRKEESGNFKVGSVSIFVLKNGEWQLEQKVWPEDVNQRTGFGTAVAISGGQLLVGGPWSDELGRNSGSVYTFHLEGDTWIHGAKLFGSDTSQGDQFGGAIVLNRGRAAIRGSSIYIFDLLESGWTETALIKPVQDTVNKYLGRLLALSGDRLAVGTDYTVEVGDTAAIIYDFDGTDWNESVRKTFPGSSKGYGINSSIVISQDHLLLGYPGNSDKGRSAGAVYSYHADGQNWSEVNKVYAKNGAAWDKFGYDVEIDGNHALVGSEGDDEVEQNSGAVYAYEFNGTSWVLLQKLKPVLEDSVYYCGSETSLFEDRLLMSCSPSGSTDPSRVFVFDFDGKRWRQTGEITPQDGSSIISFGTSVDLDQNRAAISARTSPNGYVDASVYIFDFNGSDWVQSARLDAENLSWFFEIDLDLSADRILVGAPSETVNDIFLMGSAYLYEFDGYTWNLRHKFIPPEVKNWVKYGATVSLLGDRVLIGQVQGPEMAYIYDFQNGVWSLTQTLLDPHYDGQNHSLSTAKKFYKTKFDSDLSEDRAILSSLSSYKDGYATSAFVFDFTGQKWELNTQLIPPNQLRSNGLVSSVSISGDKVIIGNSGNDDLGKSSGSAFIYGKPFYHVSGVVEGLAEENQLSMVINDGDAFSVGANGEFVYPDVILDGYDISVHVTEQPTTPSQTCIPYPEQGTIDGQDFTDLFINCETNRYSIGGSLSGLAEGSHIVLQNNEGDELVLNADGIFTFSEFLVDESDYQVSIVSLETTANKVCTLSNQSGTLSGEDVNNVDIICVDTYLVGGHVIGLEAGNQIALSINSSPDLGISENGDFVFSERIPDGANYTVRVVSQPASGQQLCSVGAGTGQVEGHDVNNVIIRCDQIDI